MVKNIAIQRISVVPPWSSVDHTRRGIHFEGVNAVEDAHEGPVPLHFSLSQQFVRALAHSESRSFAMSAQEQISAGPKLPLVDHLAALQIRARRPLLSHFGL